MLEKLTHRNFTPLLHESFTVTFGDQPYALELAEVKQAEERYSDPARRRAFSLMFTGPSEPMLPQGNHTFAHDKLGELELFTVPLGPVRDRQHYEVVFT